MTEELKACSSNPRVARRGEKVPSAGGTVGDAFGLLDLGSLSGEGSRVWFRGTGLAAVGTEGLLGELVGLLLEEQLERSLGEPLCGGRGDLLHGSEIDIQPRPVVAERSLRNDFAPLGRQCPESVQFLRCELGCGHG